MSEPPRPPVKEAASMPPYSGEAVYPSGMGPATAPPLSVVMDMAREGGQVLVAERPADYGYVAACPTVDDMPPRGGKVTLIGLVSNYQLNGQQGVVTGYRSDGAVLVDMGDNSPAPVHPSNLQWGISAISMGHAPAIIDPQMNESVYAGNVVIRIPPQAQQPAGDPNSCCPEASSEAPSFYRRFLWIWTSFFMMCVSLPCAFVLPFLAFAMFPWCAMAWRWLAQRHLHILLKACPYNKGAIVTHPTAVIKNGTLGSYVCSGHTWLSLIYILVVTFPCSVFSVIVSCFMLPGAILFCCRPWYWAACNIVRGLLVFERSMAMCFLGKRVCEYDRGFEDAINQCRVVRSTAIEGGVVNETTPVLTQDGPAGAPVDSWLVSRQRSQEELQSVEKFRSAFTRLFGQTPRLKDITIQAARDGRGPRHFVTIADSVDEAERLKLIKAYKQTFATMYVHIVDAEELQRQEGTDYSALYS